MHGKRGRLVVIFGDMGGDCSGSGGSRKEEGI
jgi:hypothetical protein